MSTKSTKRRLRNLLKKNNKCYWCGCEVVKYAHIEHQSLPNNAATIDHLYSKFDSLRYIIKGKEVTVLSCWKCNNERAIKEESKLPKDYLDFRANNILKLNPTILLN